jgi:GntR family transcriptional regulator, transcriptional repressor for pyruvate dehydrogenase complex
MFQPLNKVSTQQGDGSLYHQVIDNIRKLVLNGKLKVGEKLPSERDLAEMYGVSRVPVREALKTLEFLGIVQTVRGDGVYIQNIQTKDLLENVEFAILDDENDMLAELFEARIAIEVKAAQLAALRRNDEELGEMLEALLDMERDLMLKRDASISSYKFHLAIIKASHNRVLYRIHDNLSDMLKLSRQKSLRVKGHSEVALGFHKQILNEIRDKNPEAAGVLMAEHLNKARLVIEENKNNTDHQK